MDTETKTQTEQGAETPEAKQDAATQHMQAAEDELKGLLEEMITEVPEDYRDLVPSGSAVEQIKWIRTAQRKGLFAKPAVSGPDTKRPSGKKPVDYTGMSPEQMILVGLS